MIMMALLAYFAVASLFAAPLFLSTASAQPAPPAVPPSFNTVSGTYTNDEAGLEITLPDGWNGIALPGATGVTSLIASPEDFITDGQDGGGGDSTPSAFMSVMIVDKKSAQEDTVPETVQRPAALPEDSKTECKPVQQEPATVNGMEGVMVIIECTTQDGEFIKTKMYSFQSEERFFTVAFGANSDSAYNDNVAKFDDSVKTLSIDNTIEAPAIPEFPAAAALAVAAAAAIGATVLLGRRMASSSAGGGFFAGKS